MRSPGTATSEQPLFTTTREKTAQQWRTHTAKVKYINKIILKIQFLHRDVCLIFIHKVDEVITVVKSHLKKLGTFRIQEYHVQGMWEVGTGEGWGQAQSQASSQPFL